MHKFCLTSVRDTLTFFDDYQDIFTLQELKNRVIVKLGIDDREHLSLDLSFRISLCKSKAMLRAYLKKLYSIF